MSSGRSIPWGLSWLPDGSALTTERDSFAVVRQSPTGVRTPVGRVPNGVTTDGGGGLLGIAFPPNRSSDHRTATTSST
ncbi:PQQ-dependent sugar dehydrogenase [Streptomyces sp. LX-29]|uniref:PQQ-dependent sugar dehydrogenase n=1 Tax=Streptomyces sp. LX-29 TaxID=2900152 RepID=UPI00240DAA09|nr:PQQ-dependent sugar dehydrogenase [Streptomyces sp. LX-29]WFB11921.1 PQQ-dependent sugar dehydrogenase [Streptomyces sp. LX-29]